MDFSHNEIYYDLQNIFRNLIINVLNNLLEIKLPEMFSCYTWRTTEICLNW